MRGLTIWQVKKLIIDVWVRAKELRNRGVRESSLMTIYLFGPPGIGKTEIVREAGEEIAQMEGKKFVVYSDEIARKILSEPDADRKYFVFVDFPLLAHEPSDITGLPRFEKGQEAEGYIEFVPLKWARVLSKVPGILFLDEISNIKREDLKSVTFRITRGKQIGYLTLRDDVMVIAAGNTPEHSSLAEPLPAPLLNRGLIVHVRPPTLDEWATYMDAKYGDAWCRRIYAFLKKSREEYFYSEQYVKEAEQRGFENFPSPRTWTILALMLGNDYMERYKDKEEIRTLCCGLVGEKVGNMVAEFLTGNITLLGDVIDKPELFTDLPIDQKYMITADLGWYLRKHIDEVKNPNIQKLVTLICNTSEELALVLLYSLGSDVAERLEKGIQVAAAVPRFRLALEKIRKLRMSVGYV